MDAMNRTSTAMSMGRSTQPPTAHDAKNLAGAVLTFDVNESNGKVDHNEEPTLLQAHNIESMKTTPTACRLISTMHKYNSK